MDSGLWILLKALQYLIVAFFETHVTTQCTPTHPYTNDLDSQDNDGRHEPSIALSAQHAKNSTP